MLNQLVIVGRLTSDPVVMTIDDKKMGTLTLAVPRSYKNVDGVYETDFIECIIWQPIVESVQEYCKKGDLIGIKGRVESKVTENGDRIMRIIAEKVTFLSSKKGEEKEC